MEKKIKHMEIIQGVINRMAFNSFALKGWIVTLVAGIFALATKDVDTRYFFVVYIPIITFWGLDAYYLLQERLYRALYDKVRNMGEDDVDFSMNTSWQEIKINKNTFLNCFSSKTEFWFYIPLSLVSLVIIIIAHIS